MGINNQVRETVEYKRLHDKRLHGPHDQTQKWRRWGPYVSNRQWCTVREAYTPDDAWKSDDASGNCTYDEARVRAYHWGEDGIFGISDDRQLLCFALALWKPGDKYVTERFFGLSGYPGGKEQGSNMEDVKEYYFYLDNTPTHSYMKALYKYPCDKFPFENLKNHGRHKGEPEYELLDTGVFDNGYFDVQVEYGKPTFPDDILIKITLTYHPKNGTTETRRLTVLPTIWFRNTWSREHTPPDQIPRLQP